MGHPPALDPETMRDHLPCLLCGHAYAVTLHEKPPFRIVRCEQCSLVYTLPRLAAAQIREMYQDAYWQSLAAKDFGYTDYLVDAELYLKTFRMRSALLRKHRPPPASVLDVGCAAGFALQALREFGYDGYGVEPSERMAREAARRMGAERVHAGVLELGLFDEKKFDLITLWDVIEHLEDPIALLDTARQMLDEDGAIVLETQNVASWFARLMGIRWQHYKFEEHLYHFSPKTVGDLLAKAGLRLVEWSPRRGGKYVSLHFVTERIGRIHPSLSVLLKAFRLVGNPSLYVNVFDEMLVVARPRPELAVTHG